MANGEDGLAAARAVAAEYVRSRGYPGEAAAIDAGEADDSPEVRIALGILRIVGKRRPAAPPVSRGGRRLVGEEC